METDLKPGDTIWVEGWEYVILKAEEDGYYVAPPGEPLNMFFMARETAEAGKKGSRRVENM